VVENWRGRRGVKWNGGEEGGEEGRWPSWHGRRHGQLARVAMAKVLEEATLSAFALGRRK